MIYTVGMFSVAIMHCDLDYLLGCIMLQRVHYLFIAVCRYHCWRVFYPRMHYYWILTVTVVYKISWNLNSDSVIFTVLFSLANNFCNINACIWLLYYLPLEQYGLNYDHFKVMMNTTVSEKTDNKVSQHNFLNQAQSCRCMKFIMMSQYPGEAGKAVRWLQLLVVTSPLYG